MVEGILSSIVSGEREERACLLISMVCLIGDGQVSYHVTAIRFVLNSIAFLLRPFGFFPLLLLPSRDVLLE